MEEARIETHINLEASLDDRKGSFANFFMVSTSDRVVVLDCFLVDVVADTDDGQLRSGVLASRVLMDRMSVVTLRDMLSEHIEKNGWEADNA